MEAAEDVELEAAEKLILRWDSTASEEARERMIFDGVDREEGHRYLLAVDEIRRSMESTTVSSSPKVNGAIQIAMARLEDEFRNILINHTKSNPIDSTVSDPLSSSSSSNLSRVSTGARGGDGELKDDDQDYDDEYPYSYQKEEENEEEEEEEEEEENDDDDDGSDVYKKKKNNNNKYNRSSSNTNSTASCSSSSSIRQMDLIPYEAICDLRNIAERMISAGYLRECIQVYASVRKSAIETSFRNLGIEKLSIGDVQRLEWDALESKIRRWIRAAKMCVRILFASEKHLCEHIFHSQTCSHDDDDACFMETVKGPAIQLFNFAEAISISRRSPEKLFKILDLHDALLDLLPDLHQIFSSNLSESVRVQAAEILSRLAEAVRGILSEFENAVQREPSIVPVPGGTLHPLTRYVMNYISLISDYKQTLIELIVAKPSMSGSSPDMELPVDHHQDDSLSSSPLALHLIWIIVILQCNLEVKSKHYRDTSLAHLFLMNNIHYIVHKVRGSPELRQMIGDDYLRKLTAKFRQAATSYQRATWVRVLHCLRDEGLHVSGSFSSGVSKTTLRERFKTFNSMFEEVHRIQSTWLIPDPQLREELRISIAEKLIPAYRSFLGRFRGHIESGRHPEMYIKYSVEDLENAVLDFFEGYQISLHIRRRSQ